MKISIEFDTDNAAFDDDFFGEVAEALKQAELRIGNEVLNYGRDNISEMQEPIRDTNRNTIGFMKIKNHR